VVHSSSRFEKPCTRTIAGVCALTVPSVNRWPYSVLCPRLGFVTVKQTDWTVMYLSKRICGLVAAPAGSAPV
jgi:hypothetical protein